MLNLELVSKGSDLASICEQMQPDKWAEDNQMTSYQLERLKEFLEAGGILVLAKDGDKVAGVAICYKLLHPAGESSLYVRELDTHPDYRRQGVATLLMNKCKEIAKSESLTEVWLGTEADNDVANAFYTALDPDEVEPSVIYAYKVK